MLRRWFGVHIPGAKARFGGGKTNNSKSKHNGKSRSFDSALCAIAQDDTIGVMRRARSLLVLCGFEEGVFLWAADHLVEGCAGGDHGVDAVFFFYLEVDEEWLA
jgi:hypothetical protein